MSSLLLPFDHTSKVASKEEAFALFEFYRGEIVERARAIAVELARKEGEVNTRRVRVELVRLNLLRPQDERWMGSIFDAHFVPFGEDSLLHVKDASPRTRGGGGGGRPINRWALSAQGSAVAFDRDPLLAQEGDDELAERAYLKYGKPTKEEMHKALSEFDYCEQRWRAAGHEGWAKETKKVIRWFRSQTTKGG